MNKKDFQSEMNTLLLSAARKHQIVDGRAFGDKPSYFMVGDEPTDRDEMLGKCFTGKMGEVLVAAMQTVCEKYGATPEDFYVTYLVKCRFKEGELTEKQVTEDWLRILQMEYALSGCTAVVCIGKTSRLFAGHVQNLPVAPAEPEPPAPKQLAPWRKRIIEWLTK